MVDRISQPKNAVVIDSYAEFDRYVEAFAKGLRIPIDHYPAIRGSVLSGEHEEEQTIRSIQFLRH